MQMCTIRPSSQIVFSLHEFFMCKIGTLDFEVCGGCVLNEKQNYILRKPCSSLHRPKCDESTIRSFIERLVKVYHKPIITIRFSDPFRDVFAIELIRLLNNGPLRNVKYDICHSSPESYRTVFNEAATLDTLEIKLKRLLSFQSSPSVSLRLDHLQIRGSCHWIKLEDFMNCKSVTLNHFIKFDFKKIETERLNSFFKKLKESECRIEKFTYTVNSPVKMDRSIFSKIVEGLNDIHGSDSVEFIRRDQKKTRISWTEETLLMEPVY
uniref:FTH domain-containing protein n=2 Tax=Caenorhabditis tropicalis TaxID=1561998 RepID=A0A1I7U7M4_9PELO